MELIERDHRQWLHASAGQDEPIIACAL